MKKIFMAALTTGIFLLPQSGMADSTTLYGKLRYSINSVDDPTGSGIDGIDGLTGTDNASLFGLKGKYGSDIKVFFHLQTEANADEQTDTEEKNAFTQRYFYGGVEGSFGTLKYGKLTNAYKMPGYKLDPFYDTAHIHASGKFKAEKATYGLSPATDGYTDNALEYTTPKIAGLFTVNAGVYIDDSNEDDHGATVGIKFKKEGIQAGVQLAKNGNSTDTIMPYIDADGDALRLYGSYSAEKYSAGASYEQVDTGGKEVGYIYLTGTYAFTDKCEASASIGLVDDGAAEGEGITAGLYHKLLPNTKIFILTSMANLDKAGKEDPSVVSIGIFHNFDASL